MDLLTIAIIILVIGAVLFLTRIFAQIAIWALVLGVALIALYYVWGFLESHGIINWILDRLPI